MAKRNALLATCIIHVFYQSIVTPVVQTRTAFHGFVPPKVLCSLDEP